jgi:hypothetical protein
MERHPDRGANSDSPITGADRTTMLDKPTPAKTDDHPVVLRTMSGTWWVFAVVAAFCAFALARGYLGSTSTGERIQAIALMGTAFVLCAWAALMMKFRRPTLTISANAITYARRASARPRAANDVLTLDRSAGSELRVVIVSPSPGRPAMTRLTIPGSGTTLPVVSFDVNRVRHACIAKGWQFTAGPGVRVGPPPRR